MSTDIMSKIFFLSIVTSYSAGNYTNQKNYYSLIYNVHKYFSTSCVFIVHNRQESIEAIYEIGVLLRKFSAQGVFGVAVEFIRLKETVKFYSTRVVKSLIVVSLRSHEIVTEFSNLTTNFEMHLFYWLLIFEEEVYLQYNEPKPGENIFHTTFDTEMLIARNDHSIIQEWYWLSNRVKMEDFAVWDFDMGLDFISNQSLYRRRTNLEDSIIVVTSLDNPPMTSVRNNTMEGLFGKIFKELSRVANCNVEFVPPREMSYGSWNSKENRWTGMMGMLVDGEASVAAADFTITTLRLESVGFSLPLISTRNKLYIRKPASRICWSSYWKTLSLGIWIIIQVLILFTTILLTLITAVRRYKISLDVFTGYFLLVFGIYCQQGLPEFPVDLPSRIVYFSIFLSALIVSAAYAAALTSFLTITGLNLPFSNLEEFVDDGTYKLIVFRDGAEFDMFATATDPTLIQMSQMMAAPSSLPSTLKEGFSQVCNSRVAFYVPAALEESARLSVPCQIVGIETKQSMSLAMALTKSNPYHGLINYHVQKFRDHGILTRLKHEITGGIIPESSTHAEVTLWGILPVLAVLGGGVILAIIILYFEKIFYNKFSRGLIKQQKRDKVKFGQSRTEEILKIRLRNRAKHLNTPAYDFYH